MVIKACCSIICTLLLEAYGTAGLATAMPFNILTSATYRAVLVA
jgi:hypothetical protein